jgi:hypothetical protein
MVVCKYSVMSTKNSCALCRTDVLRQGIADNVPAGTLELSISIIC